MLRRRHAARAALAALTAWLVMRTVVGLIAGRPLPTISLFAVTVCFICALVIVDARRSARSTTLLLSTAMFAVALLLASLLQAASWLYPLVLLALVFASYAGRRLGLRPGELLLILTMGLYSATNAGVGWASLPWFLAAVVIGVASLWLWQFVLLPYDPAQGLRDSVRAFYDRAADLVGAIGAGFDDELLPPVDETRAKDLDHRVRQIKRSRRVIESQFPGALAPGNWQRDQITQLQLALYSAEQGLVQMVEGARLRAQLAAIPHEIRAPLADSVRALQGALEAGSQESLQVLAQRSDALRRQVRQFPADGRDRRHGDESAPLPPWGVDALRLVGGSRLVAQSVVQVRQLVTETEHRGPEDAAAAHAGAQPAAAPQNRAALPVRVLGRFDLHPTIVLGLQAVLATGLAMLLARLLHVDHGNWVFWTAFVVIAGSSGESIRRMALRVAGTIGGVVVGVVLALLLPDDTLLVAVIATACIFLTIYFRPTSYPNMVFWLNIGFVMVYTRLGAQELDLLFARPFTTLLGALVAAGVVLFVFPVSIAGRFKGAAVQFLGAVDEYVAAFVALRTGDGAAQHLDPAHARVLTSYAQLEQTLPSVAFDNFPFMQTDSPLTQQGTQLAALEAEVDRLALAAKDPAGPAVDARMAIGMRTLQGRIHQAIQVAIPRLGEERGWRRRGVGGQQPDPSPAVSPAGMTAASAAARPAGTASELPVQGRDSQGLMAGAGGLALLGIYHLVTQLAAGPGRPGKATLPAVNGG